MMCIDCPRQRFTDGTVPFRAACCLDKTPEVFRSETATETAARVAQDTGGKNRRQRRIEKAKRR